VARIALVHDVAGVAKVQAELLRRAGHEVDQIELPDVGATWRWPAKAVALPLRLAELLPVVMRLRGRKYDVVHVHWLSQGIVGILSGRDFFVQAHGSDLHLNLNNAVYRRLTRSVLRDAKKIFYVTPNLRAYLGGYEDKLVYLPNPVDLRGIAAESTPPDRIDKVLIFTRLDPVKGVGSIFPAVEQLSRSFKLTALDWGSLSASYVKRYGRWVDFVTTVPHGSVGPFLQRFDMVVGQMRQGILSLMEIEAMAAGRPVVTGLNWKLYPDDPPPVIPASSPDEIVHQIERLRDDATELARRSREGREWVLRNHSYAQHLKLLEAAYFGHA
jgi:glycosyltransferase involved in cell wall biosynthesis